MHAGIQASLIIIGDPLSEPYTMTLWLLPGEARPFREDEFDPDEFPEAVHIFGPADQRAVVAVSDQVHLALAKMGVKAVQSYLVGD